MSPALRRYLLVEHALGTAVFNFALNALIAWLAFRDVAQVPLWGRQSIASDTLGTAFMLPLLTTLIVTRVVRGHLRSGRVTAPAGRRAPWLAWLPDSSLRRGLVLGAICVLLVGVPASGLLHALEVGGMRLGPFVAFKAAFAAGLAALVQPAIALAAFPASDEMG